MKNLSIRSLVFALICVAMGSCTQIPQESVKESTDITVKNTTILSNLEDTPSTGMVSDVTAIIGYSFDPGDPSESISEETIQEARDIVRQAASEGALWLDADTGITNFTDAILNDPAISYYPLAQAIISEAHKAGIKVFFYFSTTEVETPDAANRTQPFIEDLHPDWVQVDQNGQPMVFQPGDLDLFWLEEGNADVRLNPLAEGWREVIYSRAEALAGMGADGIFLDVPYFFTMEDRWADFSPLSASQFKADTGSDLPVNLDSDGVTFYKWLVWRHRIWQDFFTNLKTRIQTANPNTLLIVEEYPGANPMGAIETGLDPANLGGGVDVIAHEYDHLQDEGGAVAYDLGDWQHTRDVYKWYQGMGAINWGLCYATGPNDSKALAAITFAHQQSFWETKAPTMVDDSAGTAWRKQLLAWVSAHADLMNGYSPAASVALVYSNRSRDLTFGAAMDDLVAAQHAMDQAGIPYVIISEANIDLIRSFPYVVFPNTVYATPEILAAIANHPGMVLVIDDALTRDAWGENEITTAFERLTLDEAVAEIVNVPFKISGGQNLFTELYRQGDTFQLRIFNANLDNRFEAATQSITIQFKSTTTSPRITQLDFMSEEENDLSAEIVSGIYQVQVQVDLMTIITIEP